MMSNESSELFVPLLLDLWLLAITFIIFIYLYIFYKLIEDEKEKN